MTVRRLVVATLAVALLAGACSSSGNDTPPEFAATVEGVQIPAAEVELLANGYVARQLPFTGSGLELPPLSLEETRGFVLNFLIRFTFLESVASDLGVEVDRTNESLQAALDTVSPGDFEQARFTPEDVQDAVYAGELSRQLAEQIFPVVAVPEAEIEQLYDSLLPRFEAGWTASTEIAFFAQRQEAEQLLQEFADGAPFSARAEELGAIQAGSMGVVANYTALPEDVLATIESVTAGETSEIVEASGGFLVFYVSERAEHPAQSYDQVRGELESGLADQKRQTLFDEWLRDQLTDAAVEVDPFYGEWDQDRGRVTG